MKDGSVTKTTTAKRTSQGVRDEIKATEAEAAAATAEAERLSQGTRAVLLAGDDEAHERHEAEIARQRRIALRANARVEVLDVELESVQADEAEHAKAVAKDRAEAAVAAAVAKAAEHYTKPAETIGAFMAEWVEAERLSQAAGIVGPSVRIGRVIPQTVTQVPATQEPFEAYEDDQGNPTQHPHPYKGDGMIDRSVTRPRRTFYRDVPGRTDRSGGSYLPSLTDIVNLPKLTENGAYHQGKDTPANLSRRP